MNTIGERLLYDSSGVRIGTEPAVVERISKDTLDGGHGPDKHKRLVVSLKPGDLVTLRVERSRADRELSITVFDLWSILVRRKADKLWALKMQERKAKKKALREARQIANADRRLRRQLQAEREA